MPPEVAEFVKFARARLQSNAPVAMQYAAEGLTLRLQDGAEVVVVEQPRLPQFDGGVAITGVGGKMLPNKGDYSITTK